MRQEALSVVKAVTNPQDKMNRLREYLQAFILRSFHESGAFDSMAFVGGTALRFLYDLPRFSEDLDFSRHGEAPYRLDDWMDKVKRDLSFADMESTVSVKMEKTVHAAWVRTPGLLYDAGLSDQADQKLAVKIEVDVRPPVGAGFENRIVNRHLLFGIRHYDLPSLMAGKINALLCRVYLKGRDYYDLLWYLTKTPPIAPNLVLLNEGLKQTLKDPPPATEWKSFLLKKFDEIDWPKIGPDVERFLERPEDVRLLTKENLSALLNSHVS